MRVGNRSETQAANVALIQQSSLDTVNHRLHEVLTQTIVAAAGVKRAFRVNVDYTVGAMQEAVSMNELQCVPFVAFRL